MRLSFVSVLTIVTLARGTSPPDEFFTVPRIGPKLCAEDGRGTSNNNKSIATTQAHLRRASFANLLQSPRSLSPYLCFAAQLMAGLDGTRNKIDPGQPIDKDLYELEPEESAKVKAFLLLRVKRT